MFRANFLGAIILSLSAGNAAYALTAWSLADGGNGHTYEVVLSTGPISWSQAKNEAESLGGYLATLTSQAENDFVADNVVNDLSYWQASDLSTFIAGPWLGGQQLDPSSPVLDGWTWITGEPWSFINWFPGEPNDFVGSEESFLHLVNYSSTPSTGSQWNDLPDFFGGGPIAFVVEYDTAVGQEEAVPEPVTAATAILGGFALLLRRMRLN